MGVLGLTPFLYKHIPSVIKSIPDRFKSLRGRTIVIDGTLVTQRLHWALIPHKYRHVLGWYRLIGELNENEVKVICVFDGKERSVAKALEVERRRYTRQVLAARGAVEFERHLRLQKLASLLQAYQNGAPQELYDFTLSFLKEQGSKVREAEVPGDEIHPDEIDFKSGSTQNTENSHAASLTDEFSREELNAILWPSLSSEPETFEVESYWNRHDVNLDLNARESSSPFRDEPYSIPSQELLDKIKALFEEYKISRQLPQIIPGSTQEGSLALSDRRADLSLPLDFAHSKIQHSFSQEEGLIWSSIVSSLSGILDTGTSNRIADLADKSHFVSRSYERRSKPPSDDTYQESRLILKALGVPCLISNGPCEAEALASSLVLRGHADFVASEDTDVLAYEAPLLRNITNRKGALLLIDGADVRKTLDLSRSSYIDFLLLLGTDFSKRIRGLGPTRALKFIRQYASIEEILQNELQYQKHDSQARSAYLSQIQLARQIFQTLPPVPDPVFLQQDDPDMTAVSRLITQFGLARVLSDDTELDSQTALGEDYFHDDPGSLDSMSRPTGFEHT